MKENNKFERDKKI